MKINFLSLFSVLNYMFNNIVSHNNSMNAPERTRSRLSNGHPTETPFEASTNGNQSRVTGNNFPSTADERAEDSITNDVEYLTSPRRPTDVTRDSTMTPVSMEEEAQKDEPDKNSREEDSEKSEGEVGEGGTKI